jgi:hypothetical protein
VQQQASIKKAAWLRKIVRKARRKARTARKARMAGKARKADEIGKAWYPQAV